ncbi:hypothetical protein CCO03_05070 [Comamonas serinivorans]|uniref:GDP-mannose pyrophosphatase n=1 Tax=Comamonas serinivorans TaxID=1082851 RepID=A0A1Y0EL37_9BURK|nr:NUDIX hydrolase [Comamonas serinivorans]ARU04128.1 hypothetical protein CCO03_05070 [Comamonas serinivorans]
MPDQPLPSPAPPTSVHDADAHLRETRLSSSRVFEGDFLHIQRDVVRLPNGRQASREYIVHPGAVVVIALVEAGEVVSLPGQALPTMVSARSVVMERQFRYPVGQVIREFPAGKRDPGERSQVCAERELREETGFVARQWAHAGALLPTVAYANESIDIWFARGLVQQGRRLDDEEFLAVDLCTVEDLAEQCRQGGLPDAKSVTCLWWLEQWCADKLNLHWLDPLA